MTARRVLVVDDDADMSAMLARHLESEGMVVVAATGGRAALKALASQEFDVVVTDLVMDEVGGLEVLTAAGRCRPAPRVILMTAFGTLETAIEAMRQGAYDYLAKPFKLAEVTMAVCRAFDDHRLRRENERLRAEVQRQQGLDRILGRSRIMQETVSQIRAVAESDSSVLLLGESGTGKELVAQAIHWASPRRGGRFVAVNCAAVPETLLESELFGHEKGAFTGADRRREGLFAVANGGTLFLDEVGDMSLATQAKLLRVLQDRVVRPLGGTASMQLDLRIVAATNKDLPAMVKDGRFREDLYYRLAVIPIRLPSLRERPEDIILIAEHYLRETAARLGKNMEGFDESALHWMEHHTWPGNVRELENVIERAVVLAHGARITRVDLGTEFTLDEGNSPLRPTLAKLEGQYVRRVLEEVRGDKVAAAKILGVSVRTLQRRFKEL
jgi:DNA-binding NtrC family response regulator